MILEKSTAQLQALSSMYVQKRGTCSKNADAFVDFVAWLTAPGLTGPRGHIVLRRVGTGPCPELDPALTQRLPTAAVIA